MASLMAILRIVVCFSLILFARAADPDPLQDFCVADLSNNEYINGYPCKNPSTATVDDFIYHGLANPGNTNNPDNTAFTPAFASTFPGLNTLGISFVRVDVAKGGIVVPHTHPRATELIYVIQGKVYAGFVDTKNKLYAKIIQTGDVMVFPRGLIHFQINIGTSAGLVLAAFNSQNPGFQDVRCSLFRSGVPNDVLMKSLSVEQSCLNQLQNVSGC